MILNNIEKKCLVDTLTWMITDMRLKFDDAAFGGGYSKELNAAIDLLENIEKIQTIEATGCHRKSAEVNCREFECDGNKDGICSSTKVTLEKIETPIIGMLRCVEAKKSEEEDNAI